MAVMIDPEDSDNQCFMKAKKRDEPTFTLRAQDITAPAVIRYWLSLNPQISAEKKRNAEDIMRCFEAWPEKKKKQAD